MKTSDVIERLQEDLPKFTDLFTTNLVVNSLTRSGNIVTAVTAVGHGRSSGDKVLITGAKELNPITSLTFAGGIASAVTQNDHYLTEASDQQIRENNIQDWNQSNISGADQSEYNISETVSLVPNRRNFSYPLDGAPATPATGSPVLEQEFGYNGYFIVTVVDPTTFTYQITATPVSPAGGTIRAKTPARISGAVDLNRAVSSYTRQVTGNLWAFVVLGNVATSRNRAILSDAANEQSKGTEYRNRLVEPFNIYVFVPGVNSLTGLLLRDQMEEIRSYIYRSILGVVFDTLLGDDPWSQTTPLGDRAVIDRPNDAYYIHEFSFQRVVDVTYNDTKGAAVNSPFRDASIDSTLEGGTGDLDAKIDLDKQPL